MQGDSQAMEMVRAFLWFGDHAALVYLLILSTCYAILLLLSIPELWKHWRLAADEHLQRLLASEALPPLSLLVPAYNEEVTIGASLLSFSDNLSAVIPGLAASVLPPSICATWPKAASMRIGPPRSKAGTSLQAT